MPNGTAVHQCLVMATIHMQYSAHQLGIILCWLCLCLCKTEGYAYLVIVFAMLQACHG